jgi:hypothetical protein
VRIIGYHIPCTVAQHQEFILKIAGWTERTGQHLLTFDHKMYNRELMSEEEEKQWTFKKLERQAYLDAILEGGFSLRSARGLKA